LCYSWFAFGHKPAAAETPCEEKLGLSPCERIMCLVKSGQHEAAYGMMLRGEVKQCEDADALFNKVRVLSANRKLNEALSALEFLFEKFPDDTRYPGEFKRLHKLQSAEEEPLPMELILPEGLNSHADALPAWVADGAPVVLGLSQEVKGHYPYERLAKSRYGILPSATAQSEAQQALIKTLERQEYAHLGPGQLAGDSVLYFTALEQQPFGLGGKHAKLNIYSHKLQQKRASPQAMSFNETHANDAFPVFSSQLNALIFSSDRPGGQGGMDLWRADYLNGRWGTPVSLSGKINTPGDELFPEIAGDTLYFTSNRPDMGHGGMDLFAYCLSNDSLWNLGSPINSANDDFRILFTKENEAFFVSNRLSTFEGDNIFKIQWAAKEMFFDALVGRVDWGAKAVGKKVVLIDKVSKAVQTSVIEADGSFRFHNVKGQSNFEIQVPDIELADGDKMELYNAEGKLLKELVSEGNRGFLFVLLTPLDYVMDKIINDDSSFLSADLFGKRNTKPDLDIGLFDSEGQPIGTITVSHSGDFIFESMRPDDPYVVKIESLDAAQTIHVLNQTGVLITTLEPNDIDGLAKVELGANDREITLTNASPPVDIFDIKNIYFEFSKYEINDQAAASLHKVIRIMEEYPELSLEISGHTDSRGSDAFNLQLSKKRVDAAIQFMTSKSTEPHRIKGRGYGEEQLHNKCENGVECSEEAHAQNRRTVFKFTEAPLVQR
jgi:outer membrane protein OmpA-like peptidoglycan-associated protein/tetratricopeptide (TPR) repeat protein